MIVIFTLYHNLTKCQVQLDKNLGMIFVNNHAIAVATPIVIHLQRSRESTFLYNNDISEDTLVSVLSIISVHLS